MVLTRRSASKGQTSSHAQKSGSADPSFKASVTDVSLESTSSWRFFSENPDKAWAERVFLGYSPVWPILFFGWCKSGWYLRVGDEVNLMVTVLIALPNVLVPLFFSPERGGKVTDKYWFKFLLWMWIYSFAASYFFSEYFFDVLGMIYSFPHLKWNLDSVLVGSGKQVVPVMMYIHAWYFFVTYHTCSIVFIRAVHTAPGLSSVPFIKATAILFTAWLFSWGEIYFTTIDAIKEQFHYKNMDWALTYGACVYGCYFVSSFPMVYDLDEGVNNKWSLRRVVESALASSMLSFFLLDFVCQFVVTSW